MGWRGSASVANASTTQDLIDRIDALQTEVSQLKAAQHQQVTTSTDLQATVDQLQADAAERSKFVSLDTLSVGYSEERGLLLQSRDGRFLLHAGLLMQFRNETTYVESGKSNDTDIQNGFELRRMKISFDGNAFGQDLTHRFISAFDRHNGNLALEDAWARYHIPSTSLYVRAGQIRDPLDHEQLIYAPYLLASERSLTDSLFAGGEGIVQGVTLGFDNNGPIRTEGGITDGLRSVNTNYEDFPNAGIPADWGAVGRVECKAFGDWRNYSAFSSLTAKDPLLVFGAAMDYTESGDTGQLTPVADVQYNAPSGASLYGAYLGRYVSNNDGTLGSNGGATGNGATFDTYDQTLRVQAGYLVNPRFEPFVRYEYLQFDRNEVPATSTHSFINQISAGLNYYVVGERVRFTGEVSYLPNGSPVADDDASGVLISNSSCEWIFCACNCSCISDCMSYFCGDASIAPTSFFQASSCLRNSVTLSGWSAARLCSSLGSLDRS